MDWEATVRYNMLRKREEDSFTPYAEMRRWRRRAVFSWALNLFLGIVLLLVTR